MGARLASCERADDTVARPGADEFVVVATRLRRLADAERIARKILRRVNSRAGWQRTPPR
jgi:GGDEF domain-containing protein